MQIDRKIIMNSEDIFQAFKEYIANHVDGVSASDVCNFEFNFDEHNIEKTTAIVQLEYKKMQP